MDLVFVHSHKFRKINGDFYSTGGLSDEVLGRYTALFDKVVVIARTIENETDTSKYVKITNPNVIIQSISNIGLKGLKKEIENATAVVIRVPSLLSLLAAKYARKLHKKTLIEVVGCAWDALWNHSWKGKLIAPIVFWKTKQAVKNADYTLYVSNEFLQKRYPTKGKQIACSDVILETLEETILKARENRILNYGKDEKLILATVAAVNVRYKGQQYVIKALSHLIQEGKQLEYHIIGAGDISYLKSVAKAYNVENNIKFLGAKPHQEVIAYLDKVDVYIQPSKQEGLPRALLEAMSKACPAIGSDCGGIPELLQKDYIFKKGNIKQLEFIIKNLEKEKMLIQARQNFKQAFNYQREILDKKREEFYKEFREEVLNEKSSSCNV